MPEQPHVGDGYVANVAASPGRERDRTPAEMDLRASWYRVGDQGRTGSCVGWALADSVLWRQFVRRGRLAEEDRLSPRFVWMAAKEVRTKATEADGAPDWRPTTFLEQGMVDVKSALDVARRYGVAHEEDLPFRGALYPGGVDRFYDVAARNRIVAYYRLDPDEERPADWFAHWRSWIAQQGPVLVTFLVDRAFEDGERRLDAFDPQTASFMHAAALVGYSDAGFLVRCSWGESWGADGYVAATEDYLTQACAESYGVVV